MTSTLLGRDLDEKRPRLATTAGMAGAIAMTVLVLWAGLEVGSQAYISFAFGMGLGLVILAATIAAIGVVIAFIVSALTGRRRVGAAVTVTLLAFLSTAVAVVGFGSFPMIWVGFDLVHLIVASLSGLVLGLFLEPLWARLLGGAGLIALAAAGVVLFGPGGADPQPSADVVQAEDNFEYYIENGSYPMVADLPGATIADQPTSGGIAHTTMITEDGGVLDITREAVVMSNPEVQPCWYLTRETLELSVTDALGDYASWCVKTGEEWHMLDGTGIARMENDEIIAIRPAFDADIDLVGGDRPANPTEIAAAWAALRPMTEDEVRRYVRWPGVDG